MSIVVYFCDRCTSSIPEKDIAERTALIQSGLTLCATCRRALGGGTGEPEIFFCESCGRSVSAPELLVGSVGVVEGRFLCGSCRPAKPAATGDAAGAGTAPVAAAPAVAAPHVATGHRERKGSPGLLAFAFLCLVLAAGAGAALFVPGVRAYLEREGWLAAVPPSSTERASPDEPLATTADIQDLQRSVDRLEAQMASASRPVDSGAEVTDKISRLENLLVDAAHSDSEALASIDGAVRDLKLIVGELRQDLDAVRNDMRPAAKPPATEAGTEAAGDSAQPSDSPAAVSSTPETAPSSAVSSETARWLAELSKPDSGRRFSAIVELSKLRDPAAVKGLGEVLVNDADTFVRNEAGRALTEIRDNRAIPFLITALHDREGIVALTAAEGLRIITKKSFGFTQKATPQERKEAISRWESWWEKSKGTLEGAGTNR